MNCKRLASILAAILIALCAARYGYHHVYHLSRHYTANDFGHQFLGARAIAEGRSPYRYEVLMQLAAHSAVPRLNPFVYPPFAGMLLLPLAWETFHEAYLRWTIFNQLLFFASLALLVWGIPLLRKPLNLVVLAALAAFSEPLWRSYSAGQLNTVLLFLLSGALVSLARGRSLPAAPLIALAAHVKVTPAFLLLLFVWKRDWRALGVGIATLIGVFLVTLLWVPLRTQWEYIDLLKQMSYGSSTWSEYAQNFQVEPANQSLSALFYRLLTENPQTRPWTVAPRAAAALSLLSALLLLALVALKLGWRPPPGTPGVGANETTRSDAVFAFLLLWWFILPTPSLCWDHYLVQLLPHLALGFAWLWQRRSRWGLLAWAVAAVLISRRVFFWDDAYRQGWGILWCAGKLYGTLLLGAVLLALPKRPQAGWNEGIQV